MRDHQWGCPKVPSKTFSGQYQTGKHVKNSVHENQLTLSHSEQ